MKKIKGGSPPPHAHVCHFRQTEEDEEIPSDALGGAGPGGKDATAKDSRDKAAGADGWLEVPQWMLSLALAGYRKMPSMAQLHEGSAVALNKFDQIKMRVVLFCP